MRGSDFFLVRMKGWQPVSPRQRNLNPSFQSRFQLGQDRRLGGAKDNQAMKTGNASRKTLTLSQEFGLSQFEGRPWIFLQVIHRNTVTPKPAGIQRV